MERGLFVLDGFSFSLLAPQPVFLASSLVLVGALGILLPIDTLHILAVAARRRGQIV